MAPSVFVVGMPRSGTTFLARLLESCGPYKALPESHFFSRFIWTSTGLRSYHALRQSWIRFSKSRAWPLKTIDRYAASHFPPPVHSPEKYRRLFLEWVTAELSESADNTAWVENSPPHLEGIPFIRHLFPDARIIGLIRDPRAVHASLKEVDWNNQTAGANAERWNWYTSQLEKWSQTEPDRIRIVQYEDLIKNPVTNLNELSIWLGVTLTTSEFAIAKGETGCFDASSEPWKVLAIYPPDPTRIDRWRHTLLPADIAIIQRHCGSAMARYGYKPMTKNPEAASVNDNYTRIRMRLRLRIFSIATKLRISLWRRYTSPGRE